MPRSQLRIAESAFQEAVVSLARYSGWKHIFHAYDSRKSTGTGFVDLVLVRHPRVLFVELKAEDGQFSAEQLDWLDELHQCDGVETYTWKPADMETIRRTLAHDWRDRLPEVAG